MCELMGLCLDRPTPAHFSIREFGSRDAQNMDGWGLAWYPDRSAAVIKEPVSWRASEHTGFLEKYPGLTSSIYVAHVRHKTVGGPANHADTHPFVRELDGREYVFAHNGTLKELAEHQAPKRFRPVGGTDSELAFCILMSELARRRTELASVRDFRWLHRQLSALNEHGQLNCLLSDGQSLFAYHDRAAYKGLVWSEVSIASHRSQSFEDREMQISVEGAKAIQAFTVATHPLGAVAWEAFEPGELIVVRAGRSCFSSREKARTRQPRVMA